MLDRVFHKCGLSYENGFYAQLLTFETFSLSVTREGILVPQQNKTMPCPVFLVEDEKVKL